MRLQSIIFPNKKCSEKDLYYKSEGTLIEQEDGWKINSQEKVSFFSYMNLFDTDAWRKYTEIREVLVKTFLKGTGTLYVKCLYHGREQIVIEKRFQNENFQKFGEIVYFEKWDGVCYVEIQAQTPVIIKDIGFETIRRQKKLQKVNLALDICTFHRNVDIYNNLEQIRKCRFFRPRDELYKKLNVIIVDNGSELEKKKEKRVTIVHNPNTGGSGGFTRGLEEIRRKKRKVSHVVFMDDDVEFLDESLYRLYALLTYMSEEYQNESVAGRMFRADNRWVQYTAVEIWNRGDLRHIGLNADMLNQENLITVNDNEKGEYGGWWFCCYPMTFAGKNDPIPFFIHCDDVEYGLRHGGTPIILNGIQVWHETYEYRQSPIIRYYDTRNPLFVNEIMGYDVDYELLLEQLDRDITEAHRNGDFELEYFLVQGVADYLKGIEWLEELDSEKYSEWLSNRDIDGNEIAELWKKTRSDFIDIKNA